MEQKIQLLTKQAPPPAGPYSQGTEQVIKNVECVLKEAGCTLADIVRSTVYLSDISYFDDMNEVYRAMIPEPFPARSTFLITCSV